MSASIASLVESNSVITLGGEEREDLAPGVGQLGEAMNQEDEFGGRGRLGG